MDGAVRVEGWTKTNGALLALSEVGALILEAVCDDYELIGTPDGATFHVSIPVGETPGNAGTRDGGPGG